MKYLRKFNENSQEVTNIINDTFSDVDIEDMGFNYKLKDFGNAIKLVINKDSELIKKDEYAKVHNLIYSKIVYLIDMGIESVNVIYGVIDVKNSDVKIRTVNDYLSENGNLIGFIDYLFPTETTGLGQMEIIFLNTIQTS